LSGSPAAGLSPDDAIWQALYQVHSSHYFKEYLASVPPHVVPDLGLPGLRFVTFLPEGAMILQREAAGVLDLAASAGEFMTRAKAAGTDKIFADHNYSLEYHRFLDPIPKNQTGMFLEIGLGCTMNYGAGASAKIWPKMFPHLAIHFIELNRKCTEKWDAAIKGDGVAQVHVGSQADVNLLSGCAAVAAQTPGGLRMVMDDGSHEGDHIEASFRALFPHVQSSGLYFVEDIAYSAWGTAKRQPITSKHSRTYGTPIALAAVLAADATRTPRRSPYGTSPDFEQWADGTLALLGGTVDLVECAPAVCTFRHK